MLLQSLSALKFREQIDPLRKSSEALFFANEVLVVAAHLQQNEAISAKYVWGGGRTLCRR